MCNQIVHYVAYIQYLILDNASLLDQLHLVAHHRLDSWIRVEKVIFCLLKLVEAGL